MPAHPPLYILRHGETTWNAEGRLQGHFDAPLTKKGIAQAQAQRRILGARDLSGFRAISSPQKRALATAAIALEGWGGDFTTDPALTEVGLGTFAGQDRRTLMDHHGAEDGFDLYDLAPEGEGLAALRIRCESFLTQMNVPAVLVTHGITSRMLRLILLGIEGHDVRRMPGGQGVVFQVENGQQTLLSEGA
ncbi:histidine phosphatase family protein [Sulfitobacter sp. JB4-11]|uniref:histidine phosphatase family protein n=1 Tax=Sulfitobacter rhodophyticola TaxID=3238304 RepID=UPI003D812981